MNSSRGNCVSPGSALACGAARTLVIGLTVVCLTPLPARAQTGPPSQSEALIEQLGLGRAEGCVSLLGVVVPDPAGDPFPVDAALAALGPQIGNELRAICGSSAVNSASALGGALNSLQPTKTASQFRLVRRRIDARLQSPPRPRGGTPPRRQLLSALLQVTAPDLSSPSFAAGLGVFGELEAGTRDRVTTRYENGFESTVTGFSAGLDYARGRGVVGGWIERAHVDADLAAGTALIGGARDDRFTQLLADRAVLDSVCGGATGPGTFEQEGHRLGVFAGLGGASGAFVDGAATWARRSHNYTVGTCAIENEGNASFAADVAFADLNGNGFVNAGEVQAVRGRGVLFNDSEPNGVLSEGDSVFDSVFAGRVSGSTDIHEVSLSVRTGTHLGDDTWVVSPRAAFTYTRVETDPYTETGRSTVDLRVRPNNGDPITRVLGGPTGLELAYAEQSRRSLLLEGGAEVARRIAVPIGAVVPHASASLRREFEDDLQIVSARMAQDLRPAPRSFTFATDGPDRTTLLLGVGATTLIGARFAARVELAMLAFDDLYDSTMVTVQARWRF